MWFELRFPKGGTPAYTAPELLYGESLSPNDATDAWSVGVTLFRMLTRTNPFDGERLDTYVITGMYTTAPLECSSRARRLVKRCRNILKCCCLFSIQSAANRSATTNVSRRSLEVKIYFELPRPGKCIRCCLCTHFATGPHRSEFFLKDAAVLFLQSLEVEKRREVNVESSLSISGLCRMLRNAHRAQQQKRRNFARRESRRKKNATNVVTGMMSVRKHLRECRISRSDKQGRCL